jgi:hypothetical protein
MIKKFSKLTTPVNPFLLRILKTCEARTLLLGIVTFATLLCSGCANGGLGAKSSASFISPSERHDFGTAEAAKIVLLSIFQKTRKINRAPRPRSTAVLGHLDRC